MSLLCGIYAHLYLVIPHCIHRPQAHIKSSCLSLSRLIDRYHYFARIFFPFRKTFLFNILLPLCLSTTLLSSP